MSRLTILPTTSRGAAAGLLDARLAVVDRDDVAALWVLYKALLCLDVTTRPGIAQNPLVCHAWRVVSRLRAETGLETPVPGDPFITITQEGQCLSSR